MKLITLVLALILVLSSHATEQLKKQDIKNLITVVNEEIPSTPYTIFSNQSLTLTYESYPGVFAMDLKKMIVQGNRTFLTAEDYELFQEDAGKNTAESGCYAHQREIATSDQLRVGLPSTQNLYFTDIISIPSLNKSYVVRNDFEIHEVLLEENTDTTGIWSIDATSEKQSFASLLSANASDKSNLHKQTFLAQDLVSQRVFALTQFGGVSFSPKQSLSDPNFLFKTEAFHSRNLIYDFHYSKTRKAFFVGAGTEGIDVYSIINGEVQFLTNYNKQNLMLDTLNVVDIDSSEDGSKLYFLDSRQGFYYIDITSLEEPKLSTFNFNIKGATAFDHKGNTFIFIATSSNNQDYACEVFVDFDKNTFFVNRYYEDEMVLYDIQMFDFYAVLVGYDAHKLIFHSLYHGFINSKLEHHTIFEEPELVKIQEFDWDKVKFQHQVVGLGRYEFKTFQINYVHPKIKCHAKGDYSARFLLTMNSTQCNKKRESSQFQQCKITHQFTFGVENVSFQSYDKVFISTNSKIWLIVAAVFSLIVIISLSWALYIFWSKWGRHIHTLDRQIIELKKQGAGGYGNFEREHENIQPSQSGDADL